MVIGHQKGRDTKEKIFRNFGMPRPEGYRKALRLMKLAEKFGLPLFTFVDTPGAYPGIGAEERGQSEAIGRNLYEMAGLRVPIIVTVIGEGGSGGALAIAIGDVMLMLQYSTYSVISPEGCASILWKSADFAAEAAETLGITAPRLKQLGLIDKVDHRAARRRAPRSGRDHGHAAQSADRSAAAGAASSRSIRCSRRARTRSCPGASTRNSRRTRPSFRAAASACATMLPSAVLPVSRAIDDALALAASRQARDHSNRTSLTVAVGLSGGRDSMVLLDALALRGPQRTALSLSAVHVHHGISPNAEAWAEFCAVECARREVPLTVHRVRVEDAATLGIEAAARAARYAVFAAIVADFVALAHHADDQAETLLLQLLRGAGPHGLAAMPLHSSSAITMRAAAPAPCAIRQRAIEAYAAGARACAGSTTSPMPTRR